MWHILIKLWILKQTLIFFWAYLPVTEDSSVSRSPGASVWLVKGRANFGGIDLEPATVKWKQSYSITSVTQQMIEYQGFLCPPNKCMVLCTFTSCTVLQVSLTGKHPGVHTTWSKFLTQSKHHINHFECTCNARIIKVKAQWVKQCTWFWCTGLWISIFIPQDLHKTWLHHSLMKSMISPTCPVQ